MKIGEIIALLVCSFLFCSIETKGFISSVYGDVIWSNNYEQIKV